MPRLVRAAAAALLLLVPLSYAQVLKPSPLAPAERAIAADVKTPAQLQPHALEAADVAAFFDGIVPLQLERSDIAGASVLVMQGDTVLLQKGYGFADQKKRQPVDPAHTIFRLASISKLFTWTSVMQLVEQGRLDLDTDIDKYLDFAIRPAFNKPVTLRNLMTHTGGFEDTERDIIVLSPTQSPSLREFLIRNQPERFFAPGTVPGYSNYGVGLAGYIVQRVSGQPFEQYVEEHIFTPLGMTGSSFYQPVPGRVTATPSNGYRADTTSPAVGFEIFNPAPAGGLSSTAPDMGRFARMLLNGGTLDGHQILQPETLARMWTPQFRASPALPPIDMGFYEDWRNDTHWIGHEGDLIAFHSLFMLDPATKTTLFISYNSAGGGSKPRPELIDLFTDRYFPAPHPQTFLPVSDDDRRAVEGTYQGTRRADTTRARLVSVLSQSTAVVDKDGVLTVSGQKDLRGHPVKLRLIGKDLWEEIDGQHRLFVVRGPDGRAARLATNFPGVQAERVAWWNSFAFLQLAGGTSLAVLVLVILAPIYRIIRRMLERGRRGLRPPAGVVWLPLTTWVTAVLWLILTVAMGSILHSASDTPTTDATDKWFMLMNLVVGLALVLTLITVISARRVWSEREVSGMTRIKFTLVALSCVLMGWIALYYHWIGPVRV